MWLLTFWITPSSNAPQIVPPMVPAKESAIAAERLRGLSQHIYIS